MNNLEKRISKALKVAELGVFDGAHHKMWVIDQMVRALLDKRQYKEWRKRWVGEDGGYDGWDDGIAP